MAKINYIAKHEGIVVGTRSSNRTYTNAVVIQYDIEHARKLAHSTEHAASWASKENFAFYSSEAAQGVEGHMAERAWMRREDAEKRVADAQAIVDLGYDGWVEQRRQEQITSFEQSVQRGGFKPAVVTWCGRRDLAQKEAAKYGKFDSIAHVWIVDAEVVAKLPKVEGERKHAAYGPHSS